MRSDRNVAASHSIVSCRVNAAQPSGNPASAVKYPGALPSSSYPPDPTLRAATPLAHLGPAFPSCSLALASLLSPARLRTRRHGLPTQSRLQQDLALLINNRGGDTALWEMAPSAPSWRPPHQRGEFDGFPGRREGPNQCRHTRSFQAFSTYPVLRRSRRRRIAPSDPSLNQPSRQSPAACPERPNSSRTFTNLNNSLNREPNE